MRRVALVGSAVALAAWLAIAPEADARKKKVPRRGPEDLTNFLLSPDLAQWLVGPIEYLATEREIEAYLELASDDEARAFIEAFWERRGPHRRFPPAGIRYPFEERVERADVRYRDGAVPGRRTDRGAVYVLYGEPASTEFVQPQRPGAEPIEIWYYPKDTPPGLNGHKPERSYAFQLIDGRVRRVAVPPRSGRLPAPIRPPD